MTDKTDMPEGITRDDTVHGETYFTASDMATASAQGFRDGVASLAASAGSEPVAVTREALIDAIAQALHGTWHCTRVWEAWHVGTMSQDDFEPVDESDTPADLADVVLTLLPIHPSPPEGAGWRPIEEAPRDGTSLLLTRKQCGSIADGFWRTDSATSSGAWIWAYVRKEPTHFKLRPAPPASEAKEAT